MNFKKTSAIALLILSGVITGCSTTNNVSTHASAFDHSDLERGGDRSQRVRHYTRGDERSPRWHHVSRKGDASKEFLARGQEHFKRQNYGLAEENFRKAVETRSDSATAWLGLAASLDQLGKFEGADRAYGQVANLKQNNARVLNNWGYSYLLRGDYQKARDYLNRAQTIDPTLEEIQGNIHLLEKTIDG